LRVFEDWGDYFKMADSSRESCEVSPKQKKVFIHQMLIVKLKKKKEKK
jgi:hypothetical protein